jgi:hypothetical protein
MSTTVTRTPLTGGRLAAVVAGGLVLLLAAMAAVAGAGLSWASSKQDDSGYYTTSTQRMSTGTHAIATDDLDVDGVPSSFGKVRIDVASANGKPLFTGVAPTRDVDAYLRGTAHATLTDVDFDPFEPSYRTTTGSGPATRPADQGFWAATGDGSKPLDWKVRDGEWSVVVMNADGSAGVDTRVSAGASLPFVDALEVAAWIAAALLLALGGVLLAAGLRRPRQPSWPAGSALAA